MNYFQYAIIMRLLLAIAKILIFNDSVADNRSKILVIEEEFHDYNKEFHDKGRK